MRNSWVSLCVLTAVVCAVRSTHTHHTWLRCWCNGRSRYCLRDTWGLHCVDCQGNTEGRHCERCKDGFYQEGAGLSCTPCRCNALGSVNATCDSRGRCSCQEGVSGEKCDQCPDGAIGPAGCPQRRQSREDSGSLSLPCFCHGHSNRCSAQPGYSVHKITSTFANGAEGWTARAQEVSPDNVHFRWSPKHQDLEVISRNSLPVYLHAPAPYLGNQLLSYGQNFSFSLRLDRGVRQPSTDDVILEGGGLRVSASLGDVRSVIPSGQKIDYSFRLDQQPGSRWRPQVSPAHFQTLLQNLTAIKVRATFGENGRGYLDNVQLVSAQRGRGVPAPWVQTCSCPLGYEGQFCESCSVGFRRSAPADGAFSICEPCACRGGSCDPITGDCYSADETGGEPSCGHGFYRDPWQPGACAKCPCPDGVSCSLEADSANPRCDRCPTGTTGPRCDVCKEGFYGNPAGGAGLTQPCRPCSCNGHIDASVAGSCDRSSGECLKCQNNTRGRSCEACVEGFYHRRATDACTPCDCDRLGSESTLCDDSGRCHCRPGFEGLRCQRSNCPSCFSPIKQKMVRYAAELQRLHALFSGVDGGQAAVNRAEAEAALRSAEDLVEDLREDAEQLAGMETRLQGRLQSFATSGLADEQDIQKIAETAADVEQRRQTYKSTAEDVKALMEAMKHQLDRARADLRSAEVPAGDAPRGSDPVSSLVSMAGTLAEKHQNEADAAERSASDALSDSEKSVALVRNLMNKESKVKELIGELKNTYEQASAKVRGLEKQAGHLSSEAREESKMADRMLKDIGNMERSVPPSLKEGAESMVSRLGGLTEAVDRDIVAFDALQKDVQQDTEATQNLLLRGQAAQQDADRLLDRVNVAKGLTEDALQRIRGNLEDQDAALKTLNGFDQQIEVSRTLADTAITRLPGINTTIQQAVRDNAKTGSILRDVSGDYDDTTGTIDQLKKLVNSLEGTYGSLPPHSASPEDAVKLRKDSEDLRTKAEATAGDLASELAGVSRLEAEAERAAVGADAALDKARNTRVAVGKMLRDVGTLLANINQSGAVDERHLQQLEDSVASAQRDMDERLRPWLRDMEDKEGAQRRQLSAMNHDIDAILGDIANLDDILATIPNGCFNSPPIEAP